MIIVPAIDIIRGKVVRLVQGDFRKISIYDKTPLEFARQWEADGASLIHCVDLDGAKSGEPRNLRVIEEITQGVPIKVEVGGGIRRAETIKRYMDLGVERVVLSTKVLHDISFLDQKDVQAYRDRIAVSIDLGDFREDSGFVPTGANAWMESVDVAIQPFVEGLWNRGIKFIHFSDRKKDGTLSGLDIDKIKAFLSVARPSSGAGKLFFTYAGGISSLEDIKALNDLGAEGVDAAIIGRALYEARVALPEALKAVGEV